MITFVYYLSLAYVATTLLISGLGHVLGFLPFRALVRSHRLIPPGLATLVAGMVSVFEVGSGCGAAAALLSKDVAWFAAPLLILCAIAGSSFTVYVHQLLRRPGGATSCGCSPFAGPLTAASLLPAAALLLLSGVGLIAASLGFGRPLIVAGELPGMVIALPVVWGITLAMLISLLPASLPGPLAERG